MTKNKIPYDNPRAMLAMEVPFPGAVFLIRLLLLRRLHSLGVITTDTAILSTFDAVDAKNSEALLSQIEKIAKDGNMNTTSAWYYGKTDGEFAWMVYAMASAAVRHEIVRLLCSALVDSDPPVDQRQANKLLHALQRNLTHD